jgi:hypothetical protein
MCEVHTTRAVLRNIPKKHHREIVDRLREAFGNGERLQTLADDLNERGYRKVANTIE